MNQKIQKKFAEYYLYFMMHSILGWIYEVFLEVVVYRWGFSNRGVLFGPYCIIYGVGALVLLFSLGGLQKPPLAGVGPDFILCLFRSCAAGWYTLCCRALGFFSPGRMLGANFSLRIHLFPGGRLV